MSNLTSSLPPAVPARCLPTPQSVSLCCSVTPDSVAPNTFQENPSNEPKHLVPAFILGCMCLSAEKCSWCSPNEHPTLPSHGIKDLWGHLLNIKKESFARCLVPRKRKATDQVSEISAALMCLNIKNKDDDLCSSLKKLKLDERMNLSCPQPPVPSIFRGTQAVPGNGEPSLPFSASSSASSNDASPSPTRNDLVPATQKSGRLPVIGGQDTNQM